MESRLMSFVTNRRRDGEIARGLLAEAAIMAGRINGKVKRRVWRKRKSEV